MIAKSERRSFLKGASACAVLLPFTSEISFADSPSPVIETTAGRVRGATDKGIHAFKGIPYGSNTAGKNRFMPPTPPAKWPGVREALTWGHISPQEPSAGRIDYVRLIGWLNQPGGQSEDCLVLNVWTPAVKGKLPVLVSFHGGGFTSGSSGAQGYHGETLSNFGNVVVVTVNHRLGCLGYLNLADLGTPPEFAKSGTVGMMDCVQSLEWVRDNIANFGGDPGNVMIFGQSGGGAKVSTLLSMPSAKGLFHRAAVQSGSALRLTPRETATRSAERMLAQIGIDKSRVLEMQGIPMEMMVAAQAALGSQNPPVGFGPCVDGVVIPRNPFDPAAPEVSADVPVIISTTLHDAALGRTDFSLDEAGLRTQVRTLAPNNVEGVISAYKHAYPKDNPFKLLCAMLTDRAGRRSAITMAERKSAQHRAPAYLYRLDWPSPAYGGKFGAVHGIDVQLTFHITGDAFIGTDAGGIALADQMAGAWVAFAKTGNPNVKGLVDWPHYTAENRATMIFDTPCHVEKDPERDLLKLWETPAG